MIRGVDKLSRSALKYADYHKFYKAEERITTINA